ncbi:MAG: hypothetical protein IIB17_07530 [Chloroflexi bacterium]|nr:hypothetical protein [Chloroflexota bacterium]
MQDTQDYGEEVKVHAVDEPRLIGSARFKGEAVQETPGGLWAWQGILTDPSFEPGEVWDVHDIRLEFFDGASGRAFCTNIDYTNGRVNMAITGDGMPPRM